MPPRISHHRRGTTRGNRRASGGRVATAPAWSPLSLTSLRGWYRGDDVTLVGSDVNSFNDKSGNANHLVATAAGNRPLYNASGFNGGSQPYLTHASDWLRCAAFNWGGNFSACSFVWIGVTGASATNRFVFDYTADAGTNRRYAFVDTSHLTQFGSTGAGSATSTNTNVATTARMFWERWNGATQSVGNGTTQVDSDANTHAAFVSGGPLTFGGSYDGISLMIGSTAEFIVTAAELTAPELTALYAYATARYGV